MKTWLGLGLVGLVLTGGTIWCTDRLEGPRRSEIAVSANGRQPSGAETRLEGPRRSEIATDNRFPELESRIESLRTS